MKNNRLNYNYSAMVAGYALIYRDADLTVGYNPNNKYFPLASWRSEEYLNPTTGCYSGEYTDDLQVIIDRFNNLSKLDELDELLKAFKFYGYENTDKLESEINLLNDICNKAKYNYCTGCMFFGVENGEVSCVSEPGYSAEEVDMLRYMVVDPSIEVYIMDKGFGEFMKIDTKEQIEQSKYYIEMYIDEPEYKNDMYDFLAIVESMEEELQ